MDPRRFQIGDVVQVLAVTGAVYDGPRDESSNRVLGREVLSSQPRLGRVVGLTRIQLGKYNLERYNSYNPDDEPDWEPPFLDIKKTVPVWLVRFGMFNRPVRVLDEDALAYHGPELEPVPLMYSTSWSGRSRSEHADDMRKIMKDWRRDAKGRWMKERL